MNRLLHACLYILFCFILTMPAKGVGIILADETRQKELFNQSADSVLAFADSVSSRYNRVIIHLGQRFVFARGNIYTSPKSKRNLRLFCNRIKQNRGEVILWLLDSHGSEKFREVYDIHKELIRVNLDSLRTLNIPFDGIAVDLEWINLPRGNNNREFEGLMKQWRESLEKEKKLYYFATLTNDDKENKKRGYNTDKLSRYADSPLTMLYVVESGFSLKKRQLSPNMSENRANTLLQFYKKNSLEICYSMHRAWFAVYKRKVVELQLTDAEKQGLIFKKMDDRNPFIKCSTFFFADKTEIRTKEKKSIKVNKKNEIFFVEARKPEIASNYFIWEYFDFHRVFIQK